MSDVRAKAGTPVLADFTGFITPTACAPIVVDTTTGYIYTWKTGDTIVKIAGGGLDVVVTTAKLTGGGANGSMTFVGGVLTAQVAAT